MKSNVIKINQENNRMDEILAVAQSSAAYAGLDGKQSLRLRLLAEELVGMLKELSGKYDGEFRIEQENKKFKLITNIYVNEAMDNKTKRDFIDVSTDKKNAAAKGVMGKIRDVVENMMYPENAMYSADYIAHQLEVDVLLNDNWSLNQYKKKQKENDEPWDEMEKSIIANVADDVTVSVKGKNVEIVITKSFA